MDVHFSFYVELQQGYPCFGHGYVYTRMNKQNHAKISAASEFSVPGAYKATDFESPSCTHELVLGHHIDLRINSSVGIKLF